MIDFLGYEFCFVPVHTQLLAQAGDKIIGMRESEYDIAGFRRKESDLLHGKSELFSRFKNAFRILHAHHMLFERFRETPEAFFNFLGGIGSHFFVILGVCGNPYFLFLEKIWILAIRPE